MLEKLRKVVINMLYVTGDCHTDLRRFNKMNFPEQEGMTRDDFVLVLGDFGIWDGSKKENYWLNWLDDKPFITILVDGNHDNRDLLDAYPIKQWHGGMVHKIRPNVIHLMRGQIFTIDSKKIFTFGGGKSHDIKDGILEPTDPDYRQKKKELDERNAWYRINHKTWWARELPSEDEMVEGLANLEKNNWDVDFIFSHCPPTKILQQLDAGRGKYEPDYLTDYLQEISNKCNFKAWGFGHLHENKEIDDKHFCLYEQIVKLW